MLVSLSKLSPAFALVVSIGCLVVSTGLAAADTNILPTTMAESQAGFMATNVSDLSWTGVRRGLDISRKNEQIASRFADKERNLGVEDTTTCEFVHCDFSNLMAGVLFSESDQQAQLLLDKCGMAVSATTRNGTEPQNVTVFDSSLIRSRKSIDDPDLGAPNKACGGPGKGKGGKPGAPFPNCVPQGNLLIIQDPRYDVPNDNGLGGCIVFELPEQGVTLVDMGLIDVDAPTTIEVRLSCCVFLSCAFLALPCPTRIFFVYHSTNTTFSFHRFLV